MTEAAPRPEKQVKTCRYGHGDLRHEGNNYALLGMALTKAGDLVNDGRAFTLQVWACPVCRYVELSDEDM